MLRKKVKSRIFFLSIVLIFASFVLYITLKSLEDNVVYFLSPSDIYEKSNINLNKKIRVGGLVKNNSVKKNETSINFIITDLKKEIIVSYTGLIPNLFSAGDISPNSTFLVFISVFFTNSSHIGLNLLQYPQRFI